MDSVVRVYDCELLSAPRAHSTSATRVEAMMQLREKWQCIPSTNAVAVFTANNDGNENYSERERIWQSAILESTAMRKS